MNADAKSLRDALKAAGLSRRAIKEAWPSWWSDEADASPSARTELRFALSKKLGLKPQALIGERVDFIWRNKARFKHLSDGTEVDKAALNSFGVSIGRMLLRACDPGRGLVGISAPDLRDMIIGNGPTVTLGDLLTACWALGVPVAHLRVSPLERKSMHAMVVGHAAQHAILLSRDASYAVLLAFTLAHEIGHIALGHVPDGDMLVDAEDPASVATRDDEEIAADRYALELLMGTAEPDIRINLDTFNQAELAEVVMREGPRYGIEPGTLALAVAHQRDAWPVAMAAMRIIYGKPQPIWRAINELAAHQLNFERLDDDSGEFLARILELPNA